MADDSIIEKNSGSPMATSCLVIALLALVAAVFFQLVEIGELRGDDARSAKEIVSREATSFNKKVKDLEATVSGMDEKLGNAIGGTTGTDEDELDDADEDEDEDEEE
jgi:uncharacterized protein YlxW (UPF0749 family)